jgi:hypothetical protein
MTFIKDLKRGLKYELEFLKYIDYDTYEQSKGVFKDYDISIYKNGVNTTYEIKADFLSYKTGNICIEFECNNKASGIISTKSNYYGYFIIHDDIYDLYIIDTNIIKFMINDKKYKKILNGGDGKRAKFYLFDLNLFKNYKICQNLTSYKN